jgi:T6SS, Phospholipase effector Tle1-like, catalytic domain
MALYAFDGTWNEDEDAPEEDTNVVQFRDIYKTRAAVAYREGIGTRFGTLGKLLGGVFGAGGRSRIEDMYEDLKKNWQNKDHVVDVIGFSRGAALAVHFTNILAKKGVKLDDGQTVFPDIRFLGVWDIVGSFGIPIDFIINFQEIDLGWNIDEVPAKVQNFFHAMALNERRQTFEVTRPQPEAVQGKFEELWFKGVHSDIGGGNQNSLRSNIALAWMLEKGMESGLPLTQTDIDGIRHESDRLSSISDNKDPIRSPRRPINQDDAFHDTAMPVELNNPGDSFTFFVYAESQYNWSGVRLKGGQRYRFDVPGDQKWQDASISCGPEGWTSEQLPFYKEPFVKHLEDERRVPEADWFELIGSLDDDEEYFRIGRGGPEKEYTAPRDAELYAFANDLKSKYGNNEGQLSVTITCVA